MDPKAEEPDDRMLSERRGEADVRTCPKQIASHGLI